MSLIAKVGELMLENIKFSKKTMLSLLFNGIMLVLFVSSALYPEKRLMLIASAVLLLAVEELLTLFTYFFPKVRRTEHKRKKKVVVVLDVLIAMIFVYMFVGIIFPKAERTLLFGNYFLYIWIAVFLIKVLVQMSIEGAIKID